MACRYPVLSPGRGGTYACRRDANGPLGFAEKPARGNYNVPGGAITRRDGKKFVAESKLQAASVALNDGPASSDGRREQAGASRIPYPPLDALSPAKHARAFGPLGLLNVSHMAMHASDGLWAAQAALGRATIDADLDPRLREMVILRTAWLDRSEYELFHHRTLARRAGLDEAEVAAIVGGDVDAFAAPERALLAFVDQVVRDASPGDDVLAGMRRHYPDRFVFDVVVVIGSYMMTARLAAVGGVEPEDRPVTGW